MSESGPSDEVSLDGVATPASNVLLLAPTISAVDIEACMELLATDGASSGPVMSVGYTITPEQRTENWHQFVDAELPRNWKFVDVKTSGHDVGPDGPGGAGSDGDVVALTDPGNLTRLGIEVTEPLDDWTGEERRIAFCFHSLTPALQYTDVDTLFRFLHVLTSHLSRAGAVAHFHLDPTAHEPRTINTLRSLFDAVIGVDRDGEWTVDHR